MPTLAVIVAVQLVSIYVISCFDTYRPLPDIPSNYLPIIMVIISWPIVTVSVCVSLLRCLLCINLVSKLELSRLTAPGEPISIMSIGGIL